MHIPLWRSLLWTSALEKHRFEAAARSLADVSILDLEDSVPIGQKEQARAAALPRLSTSSTGRVGVRINDIKTPDGVDDLSFLVRHRLRPAVIVLPKVDTAEEVRIIDSILAKAGLATSLCVTIETAKGLEGAVELAGACASVAALIFGAADFAADMCMEMSWGSLLYARQRIVAACAVSKIYPLDAPCFALKHAELLREECVLSKDLGFRGKAALHPAQVPVINSMFSPSEAQVVYATRVLSAVKASCNGIATLDGQMVGPPFIYRAKQIIGAAEALGREA